MGRCVGVVVLLQLPLCAACGSDERGPGGTNGSGGTEPQGQGGTDPQGQGGTEPQGQGGTDPQGQGGTESSGQGGTAGDASNGGSGGDPGPGGAAGDSGAAGAGAAAACEDKCEPCTGSDVHAECNDRCVCDPADDPNKPVYDDLVACDLDEPCPPSARYNDPGTATWTGGACLLTAFRDRTPGKYHHSTTLADLGTFTTDYTFLIGPGGRVLVARSTTSGPASGNLERTYFPVWSCGFLDYAVLDACLAAGTNVSPTTTGGGEAICDSTEDWFDDCIVIENPECPSE